MNHSTYALSILSLALSAAMLGGCADVRSNPPKAADGEPIDRVLCVKQGEAAPSQAAVQGSPAKVLDGASIRQVRSTEGFKAKRLTGGRSQATEGPSPSIAPNGNCQTDDCRDTGVSDM